MKHRWPALLIVLASSALLWSGVTGQTTTPPPATQRAAGTLEPNWPNPFNPETTIPFSLGMEGTPPSCKDPSRTYRVSLTIYNILSQVVAIPIVQGGAKAGEPLHNLLLGCDKYNAFWDGKVRGTDAKAPSGTYIYILEIDGARLVRRMSIKK